jgi:hypothetical protein
VRHLNLIREIQRMSGGNIPLTYFDAAEQALQEFDRAYEAVRDKDPIKAHRLKQARTLGLLVDLGYERQRQVDADWVDAYLSDAIEESELLSSIRVSPSVAPAEALDDLAEFEDIERDSRTASSGAAHDVVDALVRALGESARSDRIVVETVDGPVEYDREIVRAEVNFAMRAAAEDAHRAARAGTDLKLPVSLADEAAKRLVQARVAVQRVMSNPAFDRAGVEEAAARVARAFDAFRQQLAD